MAQLYVPYALGSMAFAAVSKWLYDYSNGAEEETSNNELITTEEKNSATEIKVEDVDSEDLYECTQCHIYKILDDFSKNQQKKKPMNMWKCKECTQK
jgi:hypothetical protein